MHVGRYKYYTLKVYVLRIYNQPTFAKIHSKFEVADNKSILLTLAPLNNTKLCLNEVSHFLFYASSANLSKNS